MKFIVLLVLTILIFAFSNSRIFDLKKIDCQLDNYPCPLTLEPVLVSLTGKNIFKLNRSPVIAQLNQLDPTLTNIQVIKKIPNRLLIKISRRQALAQVAIFDNLDASLSGKIVGKVQLIDDQGQVYDSDNTKLDLLPVVAVTGDFNRDQIVRTLLSLNNHYVGFSLLAWLSESTIIIKTNAGPYAVVDPAVGIDSSIASLQYILTGLKIGDRLPTKIDLRFDKPVLTY